MTKSEETGLPRPAGLAMTACGETTSTGLPRPAGLAMTACVGDDLDWIATPLLARKDKVLGNVAEGWRALGAENFRFPALCHE